MEEKNDVKATGFPCPVPLLQQECILEVGGLFGSDWPWHGIWLESAFPQGLSQVRGRGCCGSFPWPNALSYSGESFAIQMETERD